MKKRLFSILILLVFSLFSSFGQAAQSGTEKKDEQTIVTIERAQRTESKKNPETKATVISFIGDVKLSVERGTTTIIITADLVSFDRERETIFAEGNVNFVQKKGSASTENLTAESVLINVSTLEGIFNTGRLVQAQSASLNVPNGSTMIISSDVFGRDDTGSIGFKKGVLTFCDDENPHWKIRASRIWVLPGNEFAMANALLFVGAIPIMYFPFFYYPKDELIFNPVFGYRDREGYFTQTTTYFIGRKALEKNADEDSIFSFIQSTQQMEQERSGLFLKNLDTPAKNIPKNYLKLMGDFYTNLGAFTGIEGSFPNTSIFSELFFNVGVGFSRTLYPISGYNFFTPYDANGNFDWNNSNFLGLNLPFRYKGYLKMTSSIEMLRLSVDLPIYSDPYFTSDFLNRKETMDWFNVMTDALKKPDSKDSTKTNTAAETSSFSWQITGSLTPKLPALAPYISNLTIPSFLSSLVFNSKLDEKLTGQQRLLDPLRKFYFPSQIIPGKFTLNMDGSLFSYPFTASTKQKVAPAETKQVVLEPPADLQTEDQQKQVAADGTTDIARQNATSESKASTEPAGFQLPIEAFPELKITLPQVKPIGGFTYNLKYAIRPSFNSLFEYSSSKWKTVSDIDWSKFYSTYYQIAADISLASAAGWKNNLVEMTNNLVFTPSYQEHPYLSTDYYTSQASIDQITLNDYAAKKLDVSSSNSVALRPFVLTDYFKDTSLSWNNTFKVVRTKFSGTVNDPVWEYLTPEWDTKTFSAHNLTLNLAAKEDKFSQTLNLAANLPPMLENYSGKLILGFPYVTFDIGTAYGNRSLTKPEWFFSPLVQNFRLSILDNKMVFNQNYKYDIEKSHSENLGLTFSYSGLQLSYNMLYTFPYTYDTLAGWKASTEKKFLPYDFSLRYSLGNTTFKYWSDKISFSPSLNTGFVYDLIRPTNTYLTFSPSVTFKINDFIDIMFTTEMRNNVMYRYFQQFDKSSVKIPGEENIFVDLFNSFSFWDESKRKSSGFKMKKVGLKINHDLHDWTMTVDFNIEPRLLTVSYPYRWDLSPNFTLSVLWKPFKTMKTTIKDEYGTFKLNP